MLWVPRCSDAHIVYNRVREWCSVIKLSEACHGFKVAKENTRCALSMRENKGKDSPSFSKTRWRKGCQRLGRGLLLSGQVMPPFQFLAFSWNLWGCQPLRKWNVQFSLEPPLENRAACWKVPRLCLSQPTGTACSMAGISYCPSGEHTVISLVLVLVRVTSLSHLKGKDYLF